jgi:hypothetical protein
VHVFVCRERKIGLVIKIFLLISKKCWFIFLLPILFILAQFEPHFGSRVSPCVREKSS